MISVISRAYWDHLRGYLARYARSIAQMVPRVFLDATTATVPAGVWMQQA